MLKLHLINLTGTMKKCSLVERLAYADSILPEILDSAANPLTGRLWWQKSEEKWQTLACCMEIANALDHPRGPADYVSHYPVHQDGSCNGLQHYAALGRDKEGGKSVNLYPAEKPQDVYSAVLELVERERAKEEQTNEIGYFLDFILRSLT
jgi:DNA-directed RNA polymerase